MSDLSRESEVPGTDKNQTVKVSNDIRHAELVHLMDLANRFKLSFGVTILCGGSWFTAELISGQEYFESMSKSVEQPKSDLNDYLAKYYADVGKEAYSGADEEEDSYPLNFLHLKDIKMIAPTGEHTSITNAFMRFKVTSVDGFIHGKSSVE